MSDKSFIPLKRGNTLLCRTLKITVFMFFIFICGISYSQQKIGYIDSKLIIGSMQDATDAQKNLDNIVSQWKNEIQQLNDSLSQMKDDYEKKKLILTENIRKQKESDIASLERRIGDYKNSKFGESGEYFQKQNELMKPVQDKIFKAIQDVAKEDDYDFVLDRSSTLLLLYMNEKYDLTPQVIKKLQITK